MTHLNSPIKNGGGAAAHDVTSVPQSTVTPTRRNLPQTCADGRLFLVDDVQNRVELANRVEERVVAMVPVGKYITFGGVRCQVVNQAPPFVRRLTDGDDDAQPPLWHIIPLDEVAVHKLVEGAGLFHAETTRQGFRNIPVPKIVIEILLKQVESAAPVVTGLLTHPVVLEDGTVLDQPGLHRATGLLTVLSAEIEVRPYKQPEAREARDRLHRLLLDEFEFKAPLDADVALAMLFTMVERRVIDIAPGFAVLANMQSSGKTTLCRLMHLIATGQDMPLSNFPEDEKEMQKRLVAALRTNPEVICLDNVSDGFTFSSPSIAAALTGRFIRDREMGHHRQIDAPTNVTFLVTGNNISLGADETSRWLTCWLQPNCAAPQERQFEHQDIVARALSIRRQVLADVLGIISGWLLWGSPGRTATRFPMWDRMIRQALIWAGGADVADVLRANTEHSEENQARAGLLRALHDLFGEQRFFASQVTAIAKQLERDSYNASYSAQENGRGAANQEHWSQQHVDQPGHRLVSSLLALRVRDPKSEISVGRALRKETNRPTRMEGDGRICRLLADTASGGRARSYISFD